MHPASCIIHDAVHIHILHYFFETKTTQKKLCPWSLSLRSIITSLIGVCHLFTLPDDMIFFAIFPQFALFCTLATSFSPSPVGEEARRECEKARQFVEITNGGSIRDRLPASFIRNWPTWVLEENGNLIRIPDEENDAGFVSPSSVDELWQPVDLKRPQMKLALGFHVRSGVIRHIMPAVDVSYDGSYRNRGMCSVPRAHTWMDFSKLFLGDWEHFQMQISSRKQGKEKKWEKLASSTKTSLGKAVERATVCLAESAPGKMGEGSHILHVVLEDSLALETPLTCHDLRVTLTDDTFEADDSEGVELGVLEVAVAATMAGSESQYLPDAYLPLYSDETLRNPRFSIFKERKEDSR
jgi:hypothetical protein